MMVVLQCCKGSHHALHVVPTDLCTLYKAVLVLLHLADSIMFIELQEALYIWS